MRGQELWRSRILALCSQAVITTGGKLEGSVRHHGGLAAEGKKMRSKDSLLYICAPLNALVEGIYEENIHFDEILKHGNFGIGTFDDLDGEMVLLDGSIYQITAECRVNRIDDTAATPYAMVTFFHPKLFAKLDSETQYDRFIHWLNGLLPSPNIFYAIHIEGDFTSVKARSVPKQSNYRPLADVVTEESIFHFENIRGTLSGFYTPEFMSSLSVPGHHLHFLSADIACGGHLISCTPHRVHTGIQPIHRLELNMPLTTDYLKLNFHRDLDKDIDKIEK
jgi:acetolactate decarboxylase